MADVFISYSRKDIGFAQRIHQELEARDREPWVDWQVILLTAEILQRQIISAIAEYQREEIVFNVARGAKKYKMRKLVLLH